MNFINKTIKKFFYISVIKLNKQNTIIIDLKIKIIN